jgi:hypothetical protein
MYRCFFLDRNRKVAASEDILCNDFHEALARARRAFAIRTEYYGMELWRGTHCLHVEYRNDDISGRYALRLA